MANLKKTKTLFGFTSPRTLEKIVPEIKLLTEKYKGKVWNVQVQVDFFKELFNSEFYEGGKMPGNVSLATRDRITRAPKSLGFVDLKPVIQITEAGAALLTEKRLHETFTRQLLKFQLPSPYHKLTVEQFFVKPYLEFLRLAVTVEWLSKSEVALFFLQLTHIDKFDLVVQKINAFRANAKNFKGSRKSYVHGCFEKEIQQIFQAEIEKNDFKTRESEDPSLKKFLKTKRSNMIDYADAFIRYMRATQLITFEPKTYRIVIPSTKADDVNYILASIPREPALFKNETAFKSYLFSPSNISLLPDSNEMLLGKLQKLGATISPSLSIEQLKDLLEQAEERARQQKIEETQEALKDYKDYDDIIEVFSRIAKREMPDPPLYLEWNVWRAMTMLNYANYVNGNFRIDTDGVPLSTAQGNMPDMEIEYDDFKLIMEVTTSTGNTQYNMEGEPVARHFGNIQLQSQKPVFCLFLAPQISSGALAHFFNLNRLHTKAYGGKTRIIPMNLNHFIGFVSTAKRLGFNNSSLLFHYLNSLIAINLEGAKDEEDWFNAIKETIPVWATIS